MRKNALRIGIGVSILLGVALNFVSVGASASMFEKVPCHSSSSPGSGHTYTLCTTCHQEQGIGSDAGKCSRGIAL